MAEIITKCPICSGGLKINSLKCPNCDLELKNDFELSKYDLLSDEQKTFLETFLRNEGNLKALQEELNISYPFAKKKLFELLAALGLKENKPIESENIKMENYEFDAKTTKASDIVKRLLIKAGGTATYHTYDGTAHQIYMTENGTKFLTDALPGADSKIGFDIFDCIEKLLIERGGTAQKGAARGVKVGEPKCDETTVAGYLAIHYFGKKPGETTLDPSLSLLRITEWANIINNKR
ncbi:MAG: DUF2089 domain-containing protein, partial [Clostridia bacterium]|nr:DUF2089 domain-containing protein [Clostridia bacterium]